MSHPAESTHWYAPDGTPIYEIEGAKGQMRPATLRDARKLGLYPGVTTIIRQAAAPQLERWKRNMVLLSALTLPRQPDEQETAWLDRVESDWQEQGRKAAERGTACHKAIQGHYEGLPPDEAWWPQVKAVAEFLKQYAPEWRSEMPFADARGFGSKLDLLGAADPWLIVDIKTKEFTAENLPDIYDEHRMQLGAYRMGVQMPFCRAAILFVSTSVPGLLHWVEVPDSELKSGWNMFAGLLAYWRAKTGHYPLPIGKVA